MSWTEDDFKALDDDKVLSAKEIDFNKKRIASQIRRDRTLIKDTKGNFKIKKRWFFFRWFEIFKRKLYFYWNYLLYRIFG